MRLRDRLRRLAAVLAGLLLASPALADPQSLPTPVAPKLEQLAPQPLSPALWAVRDADTTIYLFGTIHALRPGMPWFGGKVEQAFADSSKACSILPPNHGRPGRSAWIVPNR